MAKRLIRNKLVKNRFAVDKLATMGRNPMVLFLLVAMRGASSVHSQTELNWLTVVQYGCVARPPVSVAHSRLHYHACLMALTQQCVTDSTDYTTAASVAPSQVTFNNYCGFIDGGNVMTAPMTWNIHGVPGIMLDFLHFFLRMIPYQVM